MKTLLILGAGTGGTLMANRLRNRLSPEKWSITVLDEDPMHYYQPGFLFVPFGIYSEKDVIKPKRHFIPTDINFLGAEIDRVEAEKNRVLLRSGEHLKYEVLVIATGAKIAPEQTEGMLGYDWRSRVFDFYTFEGASALQDRLRLWNGGRLVVHITQMPIKCPVAPLEFAFLADSWLIDHGLRNKTEVVYITPRTRVFAEPTTERVLGHLIEKKRIKVVTDFHIRWLDNDRHKIISRDGKDIDYDLLVTVPTNTGDVAMGRSGLGNELNFVATNRHTLQSKQQPNIFVLGDATDLPSSKSGSVAYIQSEVLTENILRYIKGEPLELRLDRHADHFVDSERDKELQLASNYSLQTVEGRYPSPVLGPFSTETDLNQFRQLVFRWIYETCSPEVWRYRELAMR